MLISSKTLEGHPDPCPVGGYHCPSRISLALIAALIGMVGATTHAQVFSPDGSRLAAVEDLGVLNLYDANSGRVLWTFADPQKLGLRPWPSAPTVLGSPRGEWIDGWSMSQAGGGRTREAIPPGARSSERREAGSGSGNRPTGA